MERFCSRAASVCTFQAALNRFPLQKQNSIVPDGQCPSVFLRKRFLSCATHTFAARRDLPAAACRRFFVCVYSDTDWIRIRIRITGTFACICTQIGKMLSSYAENACISTVSAGRTASAARRLHLSAYLRMFFPYVWKKHKKDCKKILKKE